MAFQAHVCTAAGLTIRRCHVLHINSKYVRRGDIDPQALFTLVVTGKDLISTWPC